MILNGKQEKSIFPQRNKYSFESVYNKKNFRVIRKMKLSNAILVFIGLMTFATPAFAYLDPGAGSFVLQMLIAGIMGAIFTIKLYWYRLRKFVAGLFGKTIENPLEDKPAKEDEENPDSEENT